MSDRARLGLLPIVGIALGGLVLAGLLVYAFDYGVEATIAQKGQDDGGRFVIVETKRFGIESKQYMPLDEWLLIHAGNFVVYHIRTSEVQVYDREGGRLLYDSRNAPL